mgnify:CR=1 FL=1
MAIEDLNDIEDYIARDNPARAVSFVDELIEGEAEKGTPAKWIRDTNVRELYCKNYTIVYEICGDDIIIHEVYNSAKLSRQLRGW